MFGKLSVPGCSTSFWGGGGGGGRGEWSGDAMLQCKFECRGVLLTWIIVGQGPNALAVGAGGGRLDIFSLVYHFLFPSPSLWETA